MKRLLFATTNEGKMEEVRMILKDMPFEILSLRDAGISADIEENGTSFEENAAIKAKTIMEQTGEMVMADDSGLEVDYLHGEPGIYSARYLGEDTSYEIKNRHILKLLEEASPEERTARFVSAIACAFPDGELLTVRGTVEGQIGYELKGRNGFGYDPIFYLPEFDCTTAELLPEQKNKISHRGRALRRMVEKLKEKGVCLE